MVFNSQRLNLQELRDLAQLHAKAQNLDAIWIKQTLANIHHASGNERDSWAFVWLCEAQKAKEKHRLDLALKCLNMARFPFVDSSDSLRKQAHEQCLKISQELLSANFERFPTSKMTISVRNQTLSFYLRRSVDFDAPLLLVFGGIVSHKEQWLHFLDLSDQLKMDVIVTEFPKVGENQLSLDENAHEMITHILDAIDAETRMDCHVVAMSFGGTLALRAAISDKRIKSISTIGAPIRAFFSDQTWWKNIPSTTQITLEHLLKMQTLNAQTPFASTQKESAQTLAEQTLSRLQCLALSPEELRQIEIPVNYVQCTKDEIISLEDANELRDVSGVLRVLSIDDVHGAPNCLKTVRLFMASAILNALRPRSMKARFLNANLAILSCFPVFSKCQLSLQSSRS